MAHPAISGAPPQDMVATPPAPCEFAPGDFVTYTNDYGAQFDQRVVGFSPEANSYGFVYLDFASGWWHPVQPESLRLRGAA